VPGSTGGAPSFGTFRLGHTGCMRKAPVPPRCHFVVRSERSHNGGLDLADAYEGLSNLALSAVAIGLQSPGKDHPDVSGLVVDIPATGGFATIVALTDNTTSIYTSEGGGTLGAGGLANVASATQALLSAAQAQLGSFTRPSDSYLPPCGLVRFHVLSRSGGRCEDIPAESFWGPVPQTLMPVIAATQSVISAISSSSPR
jgi:hypothetical protein